MLRFLLLYCSSPCARRNPLLQADRGSQANTNSGGGANNNNNARWNNNGGGFGQQRQGQQQGQQQQGQQQQAQAGTGGESISAKVSKFYAEGLDSDSGKHWRECASALGLDEQAVQQAVNNLAAEGHLYSTIDEDHYKHVGGGNF